MIKVCSRCGVSKPIDHFSPHARGLYGVKSQCRECRNAADRERRASNRPKARESSRWHNLKSRFNLTRETYEALLESQGGRCAACGSYSPGYGHSMFSVDHDHACCPESAKSCGKCVRGLLCVGCNLGLGSFRDDVKAMEGAIRYLIRWETQGDKANMG